MMKRLRQWMIELLLWMLGELGWKPNDPVPPVVPLMKEAEIVVQEVEAKFAEASGEFKRAQAMRMLMNITNSVERDCAFAIEWAVRKLYPR